MPHLPTHIWKGAPALKEGRSKYSTSFSKPRLQNTILRVAGVVAAIVLVVWLFHSAPPKVYGDEPRDGLLAARTQPKVVVPYPLGAAKSIHQKPIVESFLSPTPDLENAFAPDTNAKEREHQMPSQPINAQVDQHFESALRNVISLLPSEITSRALLSPVGGGGEERMREMGMRSRAYKKYFEAWEALHLVTSGSSIHIRDDVIQYLRAHPDFAEDVSGSIAELLRAYESFRHFLQRLANLLFPWTAPYYPDHMNLHAHLWGGGKGIVLTGGDDQAPYLMTSIHTFRELGCDLPIEIMYLGEGDLVEERRLELESLPGVVTRDMSQMVRDQGWQLKGWAAKPFAILLSSFREAILIDADALFFKDPSILFNEPAYIETGTLFFKDRIIMPENKKQFLKDILPSPMSKNVKDSRYWTGESGHMQESGVVVVDKWRHLMALLMVTRLNGPDRDGNKERSITGVYELVYGDKETYWLGWELVGDLTYAFHEGDAGVMGIVQTPEQIAERQRKKGEEEKDNEPKPYGGPSSDSSSPSNSTIKNTICAPQLLHLDLDGKPLWFNGWILRDKFADKKKIAGGKFEVYLKEPRGGEDPDMWQLQENNEACLTAGETEVFSGEEMRVLAMIIERAKKVGAFKKW